MTRHSEMIFSGVERLRHALQTLSAMHRSQQTIRLTVTVSCSLDSHVVGHTMAHGLRMRVAAQLPYAM